MNWINIAWIAGGLVGSLVIGLLIGRVIAGIKYPNPEKAHIFSPRQATIILIGVLVAIALVVFAVLYQPKPKTQDPSGVEGPSDFVDGNTNGAGNTPTDDGVTTDEGNTEDVPAADGGMIGGTDALLPTPK